MSVCLLSRLFHGSCGELEGLACQVRSSAPTRLRAGVISQRLKLDVTCALPLQDGVQQHLLQSRDRHGQRDVGTLPSASLQQGDKDSSAGPRTTQCPYVCNKLCVCPGGDVWSDGRWDGWGELTAAGGVCLFAERDVLSSGTTLQVNTLNTILHYTR